MLQREEEEDEERDEEDGPKTSDSLFFMEWITCRSSATTAPVKGSSRPTALREGN